jgi:hypothetical protein
VNRTWHQVTADAAGIQSGSCPELEGGATGQLTREEPDDPHDYINDCVRETREPEKGDQSHRQYRATDQHLQKGGLPGVIRRAWYRVGVHIFAVGGANIVDGRRIDKRLRVWFYLRLASWQRDATAGR